MSEWNDSFKEAAWNNLKQNAKLENWENNLGKSKNEHDDKKCIYNLRNS